jgi:hypothetical protein
VKNVREVVRDKPSENHFRNKHAECISGGRQAVASLRRYGSELKRVAGSTRFESCQLGPRTRIELVIWRMFEAGGDVRH